MPDLQTRHLELLAALDELEALTALPEFNEAELSSVRYRLTRMSGARRRTVGALCDRFIAEQNAPEELRTLRESNMASRLASTTHIGTWSLRDIARDWPGYCRASTEMRGSIRRQIEREKAILYPLLNGS